MTKGSILICPTPNCNQPIAELLRKPFLGMKLNPENLKDLQGNQDLSKVQKICRKCGSTLDRIMYQPQYWVDQENEPGA